VKVQEVQQAPALWRASVQIARANPEPLPEPVEVRRVQSVVAALRLHATVRQGQTLARWPARLARRAANLVPAHQA